MHAVASIPLPPAPLERAPAPLDAPPVPPPRPASMGSGGRGVGGDVRAESERAVESAAAAWGEVRVKRRVFSAWNEDGGGGGGVPYTFTSEGERAAAAEAARQLDGDRRSSARKQRLASARLSRPRAQLRSAAGASDSSDGVGGDGGARRSSPIAGRASRVRRHD